MRLHDIALACAVVSLASIASAEPADEKPTPSVASTPAPEEVAKIEVVQRHVDAYRSGNLDRFVATFAPDAEVYANGIVANGRAEIRALYAANFAAGAPSIRIHDSGISGDMVFLSVGYVFANGEEVCCSFSEYEVVGEEISYLASSN